MTENIFNLTGAGGVSYLWDNSVTDGVDFTPGVGTLTYTVTGTDVNGCENTDAVDITVNANPASFTVTVTNPTICGAANGSFLISGLAAGTPFNITYNDGAFQGPFAMTSDGSGNITIPSLAAGVLQRYNCGLMSTTVVLLTVVLTVLTTLQHLLLMQE